MKYTPKHSYEPEAGLPLEQSGQYARRIEILLLRGEFLAAWLTIAEAHQTKHTKPHQTPFKERLLTDSNLPIKIINALETVGIIKWGQLSQQSQKTIMQIPNLGPTSINTIQEELRRQIDLD